MSGFNKFVLRCHNNLQNVRDGTEASKALEYLRSARSLTSESINIHKIGYCNITDDIPDEIKYHGSLDIAEDERSDYSFFHKGRIILPIYDEFGKIVGLGTRTPTIKSGHTWWNSANPFKKGNNLYLLNLVRGNIFKQNKVYVVEGYIDALMLYQLGLKNVVAIMGTALTFRKIALLARYCNNICFCLDVGDTNQAGQKAQDKCVYFLRRFDFCDNISVVDQLPKDTDPDEFVSKYGLKAFLDKERVLEEEEIISILRKVQSQIKKNN